MKKLQYSAAPTKPLVMSSIQSWPLPPMSREPQLWHLAVLPTAIELVLPSSCLVSPQPMTGADAATSMASPDSDERTALLLPCDSRWLMRLCSGEATTTIATSASTPNRPASSASLPRRDNRADTYRMEIPRPTHSPRSSE